MDVYTTLTEPRWLFHYASWLHIVQLFKMKSLTGDGIPRITVNPQTLSLHSVKGLC